MSTTQQRKTTNGTSRRNAIGDFLVDRVHGDHMRAFIAKQKLDLDTDDASDEQLAVALGQWFESNTPKEHQVRCDECEAISSDDLEACPYCGDRADVEAAEDDEDDVENDDGDEDEDEDDATEADVTSAAPTVAIAKLPRAASAVVVTSKDLDAAVHDVDRLRKDIAESTLDAAESYWHLGHRIFEINERQLWKLRVEPATNKPSYKSFDQFVTRELGMSPQQAYAAMDVAREYESPAVVRELGKTKAHQILRAAPEDRPALIKAAQEGATSRELESKANESRKRHGSPKQSQHARAGEASAKRRAAMREKTVAPEKVSITSFEGTKTVKLYAKPESMKNIDCDMSKLKRAKTLGQRPFGRVEMANGLVQIICVVKHRKTEELMLQIETRREAV